MTEQILRIGTTEYRKVDYGVFRVALSNIADMRLNALPVDSCLELTSLPSVPDPIGISISAFNRTGESPDFSVTAQVHVDRQSPEMDHWIRRVQQTFGQLCDAGLLPTPLVFPLNIARGGSDWSQLYTLDCSQRPDTPLREAIEPLLRGFRTLQAPEAHLFICHASEDKPAARRFAEFLRTHGVGVWFDEVEIRVGDSIVQKVNSGLSDATHLALLLSPSSVAKPWVEKEFSAALMRQLADRSIRVIPMLLARCPIPPLLSDLKYADCDNNETAGFQMVLDALRS